MVDGWSTSFHIDPILGPLALRPRAAGLAEQGSFLLPTKRARLSTPAPRPQQLTIIRPECRVHANAVVRLGLARVPLLPLTSTGHCTTPDVSHPPIEFERCRAKAVGRSAVSARWRDRRGRRSARRASPPGSRSRASCAGGR